MNIEEQVITSLEAALNIRLDRAKTSAATPLLGALPEFDSMAVVALLATMEERLGITVDDDEIDGSMFATVGSLTEFVRGKLAA